VTVPALLAAVVFLLVNAPGIVATAADGVALHADELLAALESSDVGAGAVSLLRAVALVLPALGLALTFGLIARRLARAFRASLPKGRPVIWPEPGRSAATIVWNALFDLSIVLVLASLALAALGISGAALL
jgi:hypothetical protein